MAPVLGDPKNPVKKMYLVLSEFSSLSTLVLDYSEQSFLPWTHLINWQSLGKVCCVWEEAPCTHP